MALFGKATPTVRKQLIAMLLHVAGATTGAIGFALVPKDFAEKASSLEPTLFELNRTVAPDATGNVQVRLTPAGLEVAAQQGAKAGAPAGEQPTNGAAKPTFELEPGIPVPVSKRGGANREETYPFDKMEVGQSFFIAATEAQPNPAKAMGSTISSANRRYVTTFPLTVGRDKKPHPKAGQPTGKDGRKFTVRPRTVADGEKSNGARIWRVQ